ncbi:phosphoglycerate mutase family protein [archaeon]|jgi:2,3-bisphosphoglycerate-dependent phosphoglycerate mutase|nr:phosphoglycerate mutase family protein [archaeon]MBT4241758.1 phosphoglycerate mutase family protein [archaeon]MBT4418306.1 phosphoglycerate mutase family protein [archaeon]
MTKLKIYLFRHGQTYYNKNKVFTGWKDSKLTPKGIKQAKIIAKKLKGKKFQVAFYTRLSRSKDTLKEVLKYHPECKKLIKDDKMIERSYGSLQGMSHKKFIELMGKRKLNLMKEGDAVENLDKESRKEIEKLLGKSEYDAVHRGYNIPPPKGESFEMVEKRVKEFIKGLKKFMKKEKVNVAISAHGNSIRLFRKIMEKASKKETVKWIIPYEDYFEYTVEA